MDVRTELEATGQIAQFDRLLGDDGKWRANKRKATGEVKAKTPRLSEDSKPVKALELIRASGEAGMPQSELVRLTKMKNSVSLNILALEQKAVRTADNRWFTPANLPTDELRVPRHVEAASPAGRGGG